MKIQINGKPEKLKWKQTRTLKRIPLLLDPFPALPVLAIDPGVNFGMTTISDGEAWAYNGSLTKHDNSAEYAWEAMELISSVLYVMSRINIDVVIEGAAYHKIFGQVGLADVRTGFYLGARQVLGSPDSIHIVAPMSARKVVFNDGKAEPWLYWPTIQHNAVDSLVLALWQLGAQVRPEAQD
jgi:hypothetical protein